MSIEIRTKQDPSSRGAPSSSARGGGEKNGLKIALAAGLFLIAAIVLAMYLGVFSGGSSHRGTGVSPEQQQQRDQEWEKANQQQQNAPNRRVAPPVGS